MLKKFVWLGGDFFLQMLTVYEREILFFEQKSLMSKQKKKQEIRDHRDARRFYTIVAISTLVLLVLMYFMYQNFG